MLFTKYLRDSVRSGSLTTTVRIWQRPHVTVGRRYRMEEGEIEVDSIALITLAGITPTSPTPAATQASGICSR